MKESPEKRAYTLTEQGTDRYASLEMAQAAALPVVARALAIAIRKQVQEEKYSAIIDLPTKDENMGDGSSKVK